MKAILFKLFVGKNAAALGRALAQLIAGAILASVLFHGGEVPDLSPVPGTDPAIADAYRETAPTAEELRDGMTVEELARVAMAFLLVWAARFISYLRGRNLDWLASILGWIIGRSIPSLMRCLMDVAAGGLLYLGIAKPEAATMPLASVIAALILWIASRLSSALEDGVRNPVTRAVPVGVYDDDPFRE